VNMHDGLIEIHYEIGLFGEPLDEGDDPPQSYPVGLPETHYKPGWSFWWDQGRQLHWNIKVVPPALKAQDSVTGEARPISWRYVVTQPKWDDAWRCIIGIDCFHLSGEWFEWNGEKLMHPHRPGSFYPFRTPPT